eukprot:2685279-Prymnesium_polylepis.1
MRWRWKLRNVRARRPPADPACRPAYTPAISRRVRPSPRSTGRREVEATDRVCDSRLTGQCA